MSVHFQGFSPYLFYEDAAAALDWLSRVFGFEELVRYVNEEGVVQEAEMKAGDTVVMLCGMGPGWWAKQDAPGPAGHLNIVYVDDVDAHWASAKAAGLTADAPSDKPYGARVYSADDIGGHTWNFWQKISDTVQLEEGWREIRPGQEA